MQIRAIGGLECSVKGSAARGWKLGDPEPPAGIIKPTRAVDDVDMGFTLSPSDYDDFVKELKNVVADLEGNGLTKLQVTNILNDIKISDGALMYNKIFKDIPVGNSKFVDKIRDAGKPHTSFDFDKINFAIIKKGGKYDNLPEVTFKY